MRVKKLLKIGVVLIVVTAFVLIAAAIAVRLYLTPERLGAIAQSVARTHLTTDVHIESISLKLFRSIEVRGVKVAQPEGFEGDTLAGLDRVMVRFRLLPLLRRRLEVTEVALDSPHLSVNRSADGKLNMLTVLRESPQPEEPPPDKPFQETDAGTDDEDAEKTGFAAEIRSMRVRDGDLLFVDKSAGIDVAVKGLDVALKGGLEADGSVSAAGDISVTAISANAGDDALAHNVPVTCSFDLALDRTQTAAQLNEVQIALLGTRTDVSGTVNRLGPDAALDLSISSAIDMGQLTEETRSALPVVSLPVRTTGTVNLSVAVGGTVPNPNVSVEIDSPSIRIEQVESSATESAAPPPTPPAATENAPVQTDEAQPIGPFDLAFLTVQLAARCGRLEYDRYEIAPIEVAASLKNNKFAVEKATLGIAKGIVNATSTVDLDVAGLAYSGTVSAQDIDISTLLAYTSPKLGNSLSGRCVAEAEVSGRGTDLDRADTTISGKLHSEFVDGAVTWPAFVNALGPLLGLSDLSSIPVVTADASINATDSKVHVAPFVLHGSEMTLETEGTVTTQLALEMDLTVTLSQQLTARISKSKDFQKYGTSNGRLVVPFTVSGTLDSPKLRPNLKAVAQQAGEKLREEIKEEVSDKIRDEIGEELGDEAGEILGETLGDVLDEVAPKLEGLLDGIFKPK